MFARTPVVTLSGGIAAMRLKLWDEESGSLVPFGGSPDQGDDGWRAVGEGSAKLKGIKCF